MTTKYETGYVNGYRYLKTNPGQCHACSAWVKAREHVFKADQARARGDSNLAIALLKETIRSTPKHIDGSYKHTMADLSFEIAQLYAEHDPAQAQRWLNSVLKIIPSHTAARELRDTLSNLKTKNSTSISPPETTNFAK